MAKSGHASQQLIFLSDGRYGFSVTTSAPRGNPLDRDAAVTLEKAEIRQRARAFARSWRGVTSQQSEKQPFWDAFFDVFGVRRRQVAVYEAIAQRASTGRHGWVDLLLPGQMAVEHKSAGESLDAAMGQLIDYLPSLVDGHVIPRAGFHVIPQVLAYTCFT
jgi:hypothetical protein